MQRIHSLVTAALVAAASTTPLAAQFVEAERSALPRRPAEAKDVFVADLNQDGVPDIALTDGRQATTTGWLSVLLSDGRGRWLPVTQLPSGPLLGLGDADGDGDADAWFYNGIAINLGGTFVNIPGPTASDRVVIADFTGDGIADFEPLPFGSRGTAFDADGDGDLDLAATAAGAAYLRVNQNGVLGPATTAPLPAVLSAQAIAAGDVDGDGDQDLVLGTANGARLLQNLGGGTFVDVTAQLGPQTAAVTAIALGDVDGDGLMDLVFGGPTDGRVMKNLGGSFVELSTAFDHRGRNTQALALADFDLDGDLDLVQGCATIGPPIQVQSVGRGTDVRLLWNDGNGTLRDGFRSDLPAAPGNASGREAAVADLNGDGAADLVIAGSDNAVYYNDGVARFSRSAQMFPVSGGSVVLGDLDGDGDADCVLFAADQLWTLQNDGVGSLITWQGPYTTPETIVDVAIGDVDGDGAPDLFVAQVAPGIGPFNPMTPAVDQVWLGQGNGAFALASGWTTTPTTPSDVALADLDGDGDLDVLDPHFVQIQANGSFAVTPIPGPFTGIARLALGDLDGDGDLDGVVATRCSICGGGFDDPVNGLLRNDGAGVFTAVAWPQTNFRGSYGVAVGDLDGDGDDDALFGNGSVNQWYDQVVTNLGGGQWSFGPATIDGEEEDDTRQVLLADLDRDGDLDYFAWCAPTPQAGPVRSRVFRNYTRQLAAPLPPRLGRDYDLEAHGAPLGAGVWLALQPALVQTPFGVLGIGPLGLAPLVTLPAPATGTVARTSFVLPAAPSLAGLTIYLQAIDFASLRLSNALHETFVGW